MILFMILFLKQAQERDIKEFFEGCAIDRDGEMLIPCVCLCVCVCVCMCMCMCVCMCMYVCM